MRGCIFLWLVVACGAGSRPEPPAAPSPASPPASPAPAATATAAVPSGGSVLIGDIPATKHFDPRPAIEATEPALLECYNTARANDPGLSGKLKMRVVINAAGSVVDAQAEPGGSANTPVLAQCASDALKAAAFPKPGGTATVIAPLVFRPE